MITVLSILSFLDFLVYLCYYFRIYREVPPSLSETFYIIDHPYLFALSMFGMVFTIVAPIVDVTPDNLRFLAFLCPAGIGFVGSSPLFKERTAGVVHTTGAVVAAVAGLLWVVLATRAWLVIPACIAVAAVLAYWSGTLLSCKTFWLEMVAFCSVYSALMLSL